MNKEILRLAVPAIVSNITTPLLGLVDTAITGHMGSPAYLAAIALGSSMFSLSYWLLNFLRVSTSGLTSQAYGAARASTPSDSLSSITYHLLRRALVIALGLSLVLIFISPWLADALIWFFDPSSVDEGDLARIYFRILIFGAPAVLCSYSLSGWLLGMQDSRLPMYMSITTNVTNIIVSLILVYGFHLKIVGVAIGTLVSQYLGLALGLLISHRRFHFFSLHSPQSSPRHFTPHSSFFTLNLDIFLRTLCLVAVTLFFTRAGARAGSDVLAANAILMQLFILFSYFMDGFAFAGEAMAGKYYGMHQPGMLRRTVSGLFRYGSLVALIFTLIYAFLGRPILELLTDESSVVDTAMTYLAWAIAVPFVSVAAFVWDGIFIGLTMARQMLLSMFLAALTFFLLYFLLPPTNHHLWLSFLAYLLIRSLIQSLIYLKRTSS